MIFGDRFECVACGIVSLSFDVFILCHRWGARTKHADKRNNHSAVFLMYLNGSKVIHVTFVEDSFKFKTELAHINWGRRPNI